MDASKVLVLLSVCLALAVAEQIIEPENCSENYIINGRPAAPGQHQSFGVLMDPRTEVRSCSATILNNHWAISTMTCVGGKTYQNQNGVHPTLALTIAISSPMMQMLRLTTIRIIGGQPNDGGANIGLVRTLRGIAFNNVVQPATLIRSIIDYERTYLLRAIGVDTTTVSAKRIFDTIDDC